MLEEAMCCAEHELSSSCIRLCTNHFRKWNGWSKKFTPNWKNILAYFREIGGKYGNHLLKTLSEQCYNDKVRQSLITCLGVGK